MNYEIIATEIKAETQLKLRQQGLEGFAIRVESEIDVTFWRPLIEATLPNKALEFFPIFSGASKVARGLTDIKKYINFADEQLIFCIDADYNYLLDDPTLSKNFIFHTYVYSIENYWSYAEGLKETLEKAISTEGVAFTFEEFFKDYSSIIYECLIYSLFSTKVEDGRLSNISLGIKAGLKTITSIQKSLNLLKEDFQNEVALLKSMYDYKKNFIVFKRRLTALGLNRENAYLFLRGHDLFDRVTVKIMQHIGDPIYKSKIEEFKSKADFHGLRNYQLSCGEKNYGERLKEYNKSFQNSNFYQEIINDIKTAFQK